MFSVHGTTRCLGRRPSRETGTRHHVDTTEQMPHGGYFTSVVTWLERVVVGLCGFRLDPEFESGNGTAM